MQIYLPEFIALFSLNFLNLVSPGPETAMMIHNSSRHSRKIGFYTGLGIVCSTIIHKTYTLLGFGMFIAKSPILFTGIKVAGSLYLFYLAYQVFFSTKKTENPIENSIGLTPKKAFKIGFLMDILHPSASLFFMSIFAATVNPETPFKIQAFYTVLLVMTSITWYTFLSYCFSNKLLVKYINKAGAITDKITGIALFGLGIRLAMITIK
jgi:threonine/homoserine/homoserine lactone efflux protein